MEEYDSNKEFCKLTKSIPMGLFKANCKDINYNEQLNITYRNKVIKKLSILLILILLLFYLLLFNKKTSILKSRINIGVLFMICIILSLYYSIMSYLDFGIQGPDGDKGVQGNTGIQGPPGFLGPTGYKGKVGNIGKNGTSGPPGPPGIIGDQGPPGIRGIRGERGLQGRKGYKGQQGEKGVSGTLGSNGQIGPTGYSGKNNSIIVTPADGDSSKLFPVFTYNSDSQQTTWLNSLPYFDVHNEISSNLKCDTEKATMYPNLTYNECKNICTNDLDEDGYKKCVGIYGNLNKENPNGVRGDCYICPERIYSKQTFMDIPNLPKYPLYNMSYIPKSANGPDPTVSWTNFISGYRLKTLKSESENDSAHVYKTNFHVTTK